METSKRPEELKDRFLEACGELREMYGGEKQEELADIDPAQLETMASARLLDDILRMGAGCIYSGTLTVDGVLRQIEGTREFYGQHASYGPTWQAIIRRKLLLKMADLNLPAPAGGDGKILDIRTRARRETRGVN